MNEAQSKIQLEITMTSEDQLHLCKAVKYNLSFFKCFHGLGNWVGEQSRINNSLQALYMPIHSVKLSIGYRTLKFVNIFSQISHRYFQIEL